MNTFEQVRDIIAQTLSCEKDEVTEGSSLTDDLGADSLDAVELCMALEEAFGITIEDSELSEFNVAGDIVKFIDSKKR